MLLAAVIMMVAGSAVIISKKNKSAGGNDMLPVALRALKMNDGWGYEVLVDNKVYIHQDCIPAISSFKKFTTESEALLMGNRVVDKIKHGHKPIITLQDINDMHIHF
ncbi:MAG: hypothetical protein NVSMB7_15590 [Chitinophagaceae bacterium]